MLLNACKDIGFALNEKNNYMETGSHRSLTENEHIAVGSSSYKKWKPLNNLAADWKIRIILINKENLQYFSNRLHEIQTGKLV